MATSISWTTVKPIVDAGAAMGLARGEILRRLGLAGRERRVDDDVRIPQERVFAAWAGLVRDSGDAGLNIRAAARTRLEDLHLVGLAILSAPDADAGIDLAIRYSPLLTDTGRWEREDAGGAIEVRFVRDGERSLGHRLMNESGVAQFLACLRQLCGEGVAPRRVRFRHRAPRAIATHRAFFRAPIEFDAADDGMTLDRASLAIARPAHPAVAAYVRAHADARLRAVADTSPRTAALAAITRALRAGGDVRADAIALELGTSERSLRRHLREHGASFRGLVDGARRDLARALVERTARPLTDVALDVGFSDATAFAHAFRRWFGVSPTAARTRAVT
jgi:AraC-like DNA-binding protein